MGGASRLNNSAEALNSTSGAVLAGNGAELWDSTNNKFNKTVLEDLRLKLFDNNNPITYIKTMKDTQTDAYVIPASEINTKVKSDSGLVVKLDGKDWMVASLTLADINDKTDNIIMTLYLANALGKSQYYSKSDGKDTKGNNAYCRSTVRNHLLTNSNWALFNQTGDDGFATRFLMQPKYIKYQQNETWVGRDDSFSTYNLPNDALMDLSSNWHNGHSYQPSDTFKDPDGKMVQYDAWGEDYIWLPSSTETGFSENGSNTCIWKLSNTQRVHNTDTGYSWLRSGRFYNYAIAHLTDSSGKYDWGIIANPHGVRPAIHLNFSAAELSVETLLDDPQNISTTYNGDVQTVKSVVDAKPTEYPWYNAEYYEHTGNYVNLTYQDSQGAEVTNVKNAGEYWVKAEITDNWINAVNAEVDEEGKQQGWSEQQKTEAKAARKPKFKGDPVTESGHEESDTVRWFKFIIKPKELEIPSSPVNTPKYNGGDISFPIGAYTADWNDNVEIVKPDTVKYENGVIKVKNAGTYSVKAKITSNNFCWAGTSDSATPDRGEKPINVTVLPKDLIINFVSSVDGKFNIAVGENVTFSAVPSESDIVTGDTVIPTITYYKGSDTSNVTTVNGAELDASELPVGTYTLSAKLENKDGTANSNYVISTTPTKVITVGSKDITISGVTWQYAQDGDPTDISGNSVVLTYNGKEFRFTVKETTEELRAKGVKIDTSYGSNGYTNGVQTNATDGTVTVKVRLVPYDESFEFSDNKTEVEFSLTVTINRAKIDFTKLVWSAAPTNQLEYTGNNQTVTIVSGIPSFYDVAYRDNSGLSVNTYTTRILSIIPKTDAESVAMAANYSVEQSDYKDYTYTWKIVKKKIEAKWTNVAHTTTDGKTVYIPEITGADEGVLKYEYTTDPDGETKELSDILSSYSETQISYYKVTVTIDSAYAASYELVNSAYDVQPSASQNFAVGDNKKSVTVSIQETKVYFNNQPQAVKLNYTGEGITANDFAVEYRLLNADGSEGEATNTAPSAVGKYKVTITLQGEKANTHIIVGENVFEYVIAHKDRFILTEAAAASHPYKFLYENFHEYEQDIKEYLYSAENAESVVYIAHLAFEDTIADLLRQFANAEDITAWGADGTVIEDLTTLLATGMMLRMMDGETVLNQLTISVMGDIDGDGDIGTADKARLNSYTLGNLELKGAYLLACDLDSDGEVGTADKARLNAYTLGNLDIYVGLILRATAQATSATDEPVATATTSQTLLAAEERVFAVSAQATSEAVSACDKPAVAVSNTTETAPLATIAQTLCSASEYAVSAYIDESESAYETFSVIECACDCENASSLMSVAKPYFAEYAVSMTPDMATSFVSVELSGNAPIPSTEIAYANNETDTPFAAKSYLI